MKFPAGDGNSAACAPRASATRHEHHVGPGRGVLENTRVIRHFYHISWGLARPCPRDVRAPLRATPLPASRS